MLALSVSIMFILFSNQQLIGVGVFDSGFHDSTSEQSEWYEGDYGFQFVQPIRVPSAPATGSGESQSQLEEDAEEELPPILEIYLRSINSSLLVNNTNGAEPSVKCYIPRFQNCAIFATVTSLLQIIVSVVYIILKEKVSRGIKTTKRTTGIIDLHTSFLLFSRISPQCQPSSIPTFSSS